MAITTRTTLIFLFCFYACSNRCDTSIFSNCSPDPPPVGYLTVNVSTDKGLVRLHFYKGKVKDFNTTAPFFTDTITISQRTYPLPPEGFYTVTATYIVKGKTYMAIDGDRVEYKDKNEDCADAPPCYKLKNGSVDLRLYATVD